MEKYFLKFTEEKPIYIQLKEHIKKLIQLDCIFEGEKLPSIRKMASFLGVNNDTVIGAYKKLALEGYAIQKIGSGTFAKQKSKKKKIRREYSEALKKVYRKGNPNSYVDFTGESTFSKFFPIQSFKGVLNEVIERDGTYAITTQDELGYEGLRDGINKFFWNSNMDREDILIVSGAQQGIDVVSKALININDNIILEKPTYGGAISVFNFRRANLFEIEIKDDGIDIDIMEKVLKKNRIKCFYVMSYFQNPTGITYSLEKKKKILELAEKYDFYIIEDDYLSELIYDTDIKYKSFKMLDEQDRVIYIKSFSKIFLPGIRLGYMITPSDLREQITNCKINTDIATSGLMQRALDLYIKHGYWKKYIMNLNNFYKERYNALITYSDMLLKDKIEFLKPGGGLNVYYKIKNSNKINSLELFYKCKEEKVLISPGSLFYNNIDDGLKYFRLGFSQLENEKIKRGLQVIEKIL